MDDEIDIEEHDILEHPQVKATFPDLSKIQIQAHTTGVSLFEEASTYTEEYINLLEERHDYAENSLKEYNDSANIDVEELEEGSSLKEQRSEELVISDSESNEHPPTDSETNMDIEEVTDNVSKIAENELVDVQEISDDEGNEASNSSQLKSEIIDNVTKIAENELVDVQEISDDEGIKSEIRDVTEFTEKDSKITNSDKMCNEVTVLTQIINENVHEISDDEVDVLKDVDNIEKAIENGAKFIENGTENGVAFIGKDPENDEIIEVDTENSEIIEEGPENKESFEEDPEDNKIFGEVPRNDEIIEEGPPNDEIIDEAPLDDETIEEEPPNDEIIDEAPLKDEIIEEDLGKPRPSGILLSSVKTEANNEVTDQTEKTGVENANPTEEYLHVPIKEEIDFVPIKEELDDDYNLEDNSPETCNNALPPEDIYHFNNKIILGSKPSPQVNLNKTYLVVLLEDWGEKLKQSQSFCRDCQILFATPNALDAHKMAAHSLLAPIPNRAFKSTTKISHIAKKSTTKIKNIARKSTGRVKNEDLSNSTYCNHCNFTYKDHTALIKHLYELLPAKKFSCISCNETFKNHNDLVIHSKVHVKIEPRKILKARKDVKNPLLFNLLSKPAVAPELVKQNQRQIKREITYCIDTLRFRYKCTICGDIFDHYSAARRHRLAHPESRANRKILKRLVPKVKRNNLKAKLKYEEDSDYKMRKEKRAANFYDELIAAGKNKAKPFDLIPKSALFQCTECSLNFTSPTGLTTHMAKKACGSSRVWSCPTCKRKLRKIDESCHRKQHELSTKLKIYKLTKNSNQRTLCKCSKCGVYFDYILLKMHIHKCGKIPTVKCQKCNILLAKRKLVEHCLKHETLNLKPKDFILVEYAVINDKTKTKPVVKTKKISLKNNVEAGVAVKTEPGAVKKTKLINKCNYGKEKIKMYYCKHCGSSTSSENKEISRRTHLSTKCLVKYKYKCYNCELCGLLIPNMCRSTHETLHAEKNITLNDLQFYEFTSLVRIVPSIPKYPSCSKCRIHFLDRYMKRNHICGEDYDNCEFCGDKFELTALNAHRPFHKLQTRKTKTNEEPKIMPELMMKYESLNAIWNILFICGTCELVTDLYNKAVEHSQAHLKKVPIQPTTVKCYICNLKFDESCWSKHSELHSRMKINKTDFKILTYRPLHLLDESWFQMFESLPEKEIRQIIDRSVFGSERSLKMNLVKDGLPEFTVYCCSKCSVAFDNNNILGHIKSKCVISAHICEKCDVAFNDANLLHFHEELHKKGIKKDEFRIVNFVKTADSIAKNNAKRIPHTRELVAKKSIKRKKMGHVLYKCDKCSVCVQRKVSIAFHICGPDHHMVFCKICKQNFIYRQTTAHKEKHRNTPDFRAKNTKIIKFKPKGKKRKPRHKKDSTETENKNNSNSETYTDSESVTPEIQLTTASNSKKTENAKRKYVQSADITEQPKSKQRKTLNRSLIGRNSSAINIESDNEDIKLAKIYKCDCGLHYTSLRSIEKHIETCNDTDEISKENCSKCGLLFPTDVLVSHLCKHHSQDTKITVEKIQKKMTEETSPRGDKKHIKLYKCSDCNVYFLNQNTCYKHALRHEMLDPRQYIECKICCLQFGLRSLVAHMTKHHQKEFNLENVLVEEYQPNVGRNAPKIDIYFANEKVQNIQVSSSND